MPRPVTDIPYVGPASAEAFARAGITSAEEVIEMGADAAYLRLLQTGSAPHFIGYYVLVMGLQGRPWNDCKGKEKEALRATFDALKARAKASPTDRGAMAQLDRVLDEIGLIERPT